MPKSLYAKVARLAELEGVSMNQFVVYRLAEVCGEWDRKKEGKK
jgi:hypothetical protein